MIKAVIPEVRVVLTSKCNYKCYYCFREGVLNNYNDVCDLDKLDNVIDSFISHGLKKITLTGGEPTLSDKFIIILERFVKKGLPITITTNGSNLNRLIQVSSIAPLVKFNISVPSLNDTVFSQITNVQFNYALNTISNLLNLTSNLCLNIVLTEENISELDNFNYYSKKNNLKLKFIINCIEKGSNQNLKTHALVNIFIRQLLNKGYNFARLNKTKLVFIKEKQTISLQFPITSLNNNKSDTNAFELNCARILPNGLVKPCLLDFISFDIKKEMGSFAKYIHILEYEKCLNCSIEKKQLLNRTLSGLQDPARSRC